MRRSFWKGVAVSYLAYSLIAGMAMKATMPALNPLGVAYIGMTWPVPMTCVAIHSDCSVVPPLKYARFLFWQSDHPSNSDQQRNDHARD